MKTLMLQLALGCTYHISLVDPEMKKGKTVEISNSFFFWGLIGGGMLKVDTACRNQKPVKIVDDPGIWQVIVIGLTLGLYSPRQVVVTCAKSGKEA